MGTLTGKVSTSMSFTFADPYNSGPIAWTAGRRIWIIAYALSNFHTNGLGTDWSISSNASTNTVTWTKVDSSVVDTTLDPSLRNQIVIWCSSQLTANETFTVTVDPQASGSDQFFFNLVGVEYEGGDGTLAKKAYNFVGGAGSGTASFPSTPSGNQLSIAFSTGASGAGVTWDSPPSGWSLLANGTSGTDAVQVSSIKSTTNTATAVPFNGAPHDMQANVVIQFNDAATGPAPSYLALGDPIIVAKTDKISKAAAYVVSYDTLIVPKASGGTTSNIANADPIQVSDGATLAASYTLAPSDPIQVSDGATITTSYAITNGDPIQVSDGATLAASNSLAFSDPIQISDDATITFASNMANSDPVQVSDGAAVTFAGNIVNADPIQVSDDATITFATAYSVAFSDPIQVSDNSTVSTVAIYDILFADPIQVSDGATLAASYTLAPSDPIQVSDGATITTSYAITNGDPIQVSDNSTVSTVAAYVVAFSDPIQVSDGATLAASNSLAFSDPIQISDDATVSLSGVTASTTFVLGQERLLVDGYNFSGDVGGFDLSSPVDTQNLTGIDKYAIERGATKTDTVLSYKGWLNPQGAHILQAQLPTKQLVTSYIRGGAISTPIASFVGVQASYKVPVDTDKSVAVEAEIMGADGAPLAWGNLLTDGVQTFVIGSTLQSFDAGTARPGGYFTVHITQLTGSNVTVALQHSSNNSTFSAVDTATTLAFAAIGANRVVIPTTITINRYLRVVISGTFTSADVTAGFARG